MMILQSGSGDAGTDEHGYITATGGTLKSNHRRTGLRGLVCTGWPAAAVLLALLVLISVLAVLEGRHDDLPAWR